MMLLDYMDERSVTASWKLFELIDHTKESGNTEQIIYVESLWPDETIQTIWQKSSVEESFWFNSQQFIEWWMLGLVVFMSRQPA